jgi:CMP-N,N'-diacetyllegionaminic acid synthase
VNILGLITARGGSKGIPGKNLVACGGRPLLAWTCEAALGAACLSRTLISTDDPAIASAARDMGIEAPFLRPAELASDTAKSIGVAIHAINWLAQAESWTTDVLVLLQPTSPLRTARHIDEAYALLTDDAEAVVSVVEVPHGFKPWSQLALEQGHLVDYIKGDLPFERYLRQGQPTLYARNGPAVIATRARVILSGSYYGERCIPYVMTPHDSVDIDDVNELEYADWLLRRRTAG